jgi:hypothetical protein
MVDNQDTPRMRCVTYLLTVASMHVVLEFQQLINQVQTLSQAVLVF